MDLTNAQLVTLKNAILADPTLADEVAAKAYALIAEAFNAVSTFVVFKTAVPISEVGRTFVASSLAAMTSANNDRLVSFALWNPDGVIPERDDHRAFFDDVFSPASGAPTRTALYNLWRRFATRTEALYTTGTGTTASPGLLTVEGFLEPSTVALALGV